jgi:cysteine synthase
METAAISILANGKNPLSWKPNKGLVKIPKGRKTLFEQLEKIPGNTSCKEIGGMPNGNRLFAKMEFENRPTGSHYDRVYPYLLECLEKTGINAKDFILAETSSGNATPAFGWFARKLGYRTVAFLPAELTPTRRNLSEEQCDKVVIADEEKHGWGVFGAANAMREALQKNREERKVNPSKERLYCVNHSQVKESLDSIKTLAKEAVRQLKGNKPDYFLGIAGNGTILYGVGKELKKKFPKMKVIGVETVERPVLYEKKWPGKFEEKFGRKPVLVSEMKGRDFFSPGTGALGIEFPHLNSAAKLVNDIILIERKEVEEALKELELKGFNVGHTSAMSYVAAKKVCRENKGKNILIIFYDLGNRY